MCFEILILKAYLHVILIMPGKHTLKPNAILPFIKETFALDAIKTRENPIKLKLVIQADC